MNEDLMKRILEYLKAHTDGVQIKDIAEAVDKTPQWIKPHLEMLEERKLITKRTVGTAYLYYPR